VPAFSILSTTVYPETTRPNTTCLPSRCGVSAVVMKNCEPFVFGPAFAIDSSPFSLCFRPKFSSRNFPP
jgi:hypothetical protein